MITAKEIDGELWIKASDHHQAIKEALAQTQEPVAYDKTEMNCFVQDLYDKKMKEGKHGHYETMFHVVHQAIKRVPPQRTWVGLTDEQLRTEFGKLYPNDIGILELAENNRDFAVEAIGARHHWVAFQAGARAAEAKLKEKNT